MSMRPVKLNHARMQHHRPWLAEVLLVSGCLAAAVLGVALHQVNTKTDALEADASRLRHAPQTRMQPKAESALQRAEIAAAQVAMKELMLPWEPLFQALESARAPQVKLLALEPDPRKRKVLISAAAPETQDILNYVLALGRQPMLKDVFLLRQERDEEGGGFLFSIQAVWDAKS